MEKVHMKSTLKYQVEARRLNRKMVPAPNAKGAGILSFSGSYLLNFQKIAPVTCRKIIIRQVVESQSPKSSAKYFLQNLALFVEMLLN